MMKKRWLDPKPVVVPPALAASLDVHPFLLETLVRRGFVDSEQIRRFLDSEQYIPSSPYDLPDMEAAVERITKAIERQQHILIWGDFDVDGQTATALLVSALEALGAKVSSYIPDRETEGHGINTARLSQLLDSGVHLVVTCDTGIVEHEAVDMAQGRGVDVIITDHHQLPDRLPDAYAALNPQRLPAGHPMHGLPGVGCAYKLVEALYVQAERADELPRFLDLVALGIVADVAEQTGDTRYLLQRGLIALGQTERSGLRAIMELAKIDPGRVDEEAIGFQIGPRLNALGRLDDANIAIELLTTDDLERARILANRIEGLNAQRKMQTDQVFKAAEEMIEHEPSLLDSPVLVLGHEHWPGGIIGIVANRLVERYNRPVILLNIDPDGVARGSARSVAGCNITAAISEHRDLLLNYGGHTMAAGLSLHTKDIRDFRHRLARTVKQMLADVDETPALHISSYIPLDQVNESLLDAIHQLKPFGPGNPPITLATQKLTLRNYRQIGRTGEHLKLTVEDESGTMRDILWWRADFARLPRGRFDLAYTLSENIYEDKREVQITFVDVRAVEEEPLRFAFRENVTIDDYRSCNRDEQESLLREFGPDTLIWSEGDAPLPDGITTVHRDALKRAPALAIWTAPPSREDLLKALETVNPERVVLFGVNPDADSVQGFLKRFGGVIKHVLNSKNGQTTSDALCGVMAHSPETINAALQWMVARGHIRIIDDENGHLTLAAGGQEDRDAFAATSTQLAQRIQEAAGFRAYFRRADAQSLLMSDAAPE